MRPRAIIAALLVLSVPAAAQTPPAPPPAAAPAARAHPGLWVVRDADTTVWLFGTIHALPPGYQWRDPVLDKAFAEARELVIEAQLDGSATATAKLFNRLATDHAKGLPPLVERVPAQYRDSLTALVAKSGLPMAALDRMESWAAAILLFRVALRDLGVSGGVGIEAQLKSEFAARHLPIGAFETGADQLGYFDALPEEAQRTFLTSVVEKPEQNQKELADMLAAWSRGDEGAIGASFDKDFKASPAIREALLAQRNARWADAIVARMRDPGDVLVAVGAGHLAGPQSVQHMLEARGLKVERVE